MCCKVAHCFLARRALLLVAFNRSNNIYIVPSLCALSYYQQASFHPSLRSLKQIGMASVRISFGACLACQTAQFACGKCGTCLMQQEVLLACSCRRPSSIGFRFQGAGFQGVGVVQASSLLDGVSHQVF